MAGRKAFKSEDFAPRIPVDCGASNCRQNAIVRVRQGTAWLNLCAFHYERQHQEAARKYGEQRGLVTADDHARHCASLMRRTVQRVPGEDDAG